MTASRSAFLVGLCRIVGAAARIAAAVARAPARQAERKTLLAAPVRRRRRSGPVEPDRAGPGSPPARGGLSGVDYQVRAARITDVERIVALWTAVEPGAAEAADAATDLLRQLVYLPQASVLVAESARTVVGAAVLALRTSVRVGGNVGVVDLLVADPHHDADRVAELLVREVLRSARNKGCVVAEAALRAESPGLTALERYGFGPAAPRLETLLVAPRARATRG